VIKNLLKISTITFVLFGCSTSDVAKNANTDNSVPPMVTENSCENLQCEDSETKITYADNTCECVATNELALKRPPPAITPQTPKVIQIEFEQVDINILISSFKNNEVRASERFNKIETRGVVTGIGLDILDNPFIILNNEVYCRCSSKSKVSRLDKGQVAVVTATKINYSFGVINLVDCKIY
jgi:hypothetical protein